jgi:hypothetical protein
MSRTALDMKFAKICEDDIEKYYHKGQETSSVVERTLASQETARYELRKCT